MKLSYEMNPFPPSGSIKLLYKNKNEIASIPLVLVTRRIKKKYLEREEGQEYIALTAFANELNNHQQIFSQEHLLRYIYKFVPFEEISDYLDLAINTKETIMEIWRNKDRIENYSLSVQSDIPPELVYNYSKFNRKWFRKVLEKNKLYLTSPKDFNDPFDCKYNNEIIRKSKNIGICCFSSKKYNILLYSNYADKHTGICYIFDPIRLSNSIERNGQEIDTRIQNVKYYKKLPDFDLVNEYALCLTSKNSAWEYENEFRLIGRDKARNFVPSGYYEFSYKALKGVIIGCEMDECNRDFIKSLLKEKPNITPYEVVKTKDSFNIEIKQIDI